MTKTLGAGWEQRQADLCEAGLVCTVGSMGCRQAWRWSSSITSRRWERLRLAWTFKPSKPARSLIPLSRVQCTQKGSFFLSCVTGKWACLTKSLSRLTEIVLLEGCVILYTHSLSIWIFSHVPDLRRE